MDADGAAPRVPEAESPVEHLAARTAEGFETAAVLRRPAGPIGAPSVVLLHGGLEPLPREILAAIATRSLLVARLLGAGHPVLVPTRRARPDAARPSGAVADTLAAVEAAREALGDDAETGPVLFGSSGGGDLALEVAGSLAPLALAVEEPTTSLVTGILAPHTPKRGATWLPDEVWPADYARHYTEAHRATTRAVLARLPARLLVAEGDQLVEGVDPRRGLHAVLLPELDRLGRRVVRHRFAGQPHGFGLLTGVAPEPVSSEAAAAVARLHAALEAFIRDEQTSTGRAPENE